jgi:lipopolysaccharide transport system permease protein
MTRPEQTVNSPVVSGPVVPGSPSSDLRPPSSASDPSSVLRPLSSASELPVIRIQPSKGWVSLKLRDLWEYRELLYFLTWRDIKVRYKQTALGAA